MLGNIATTAVESNKVESKININNLGTIFGPLQLGYDQNDREMFWMLGKAEEHQQRLEVWQYNSTRKALCRYQLKGATYG
jgi:hypothetical protein